MSAPQPRILQAELAVVGAGMAGMCAAFFAARRGVSTVQVGGTSELVLAAGPWDLLAVHPVSEGRVWDDPWAALDALVRDCPGHPYARLGAERIQAAFDELVLAFESVGLPYRHLGDQSCQIPTALGTIKRSYCAPLAMWGGALAWAERLPTLLVDFVGMPDFDARQAGHALRTEWPGLRTARVELPGSAWQADLSREHLARLLDLEGGAAALAQVVRPLVEDSEAVGFPAMLGLTRHMHVLAELQERLGVPVFELPTPPVSVPGLRQEVAFEGILAAEGVRTLRYQRVQQVELLGEPGPSQGFVLHVGPEHDRRLLHVQRVLLATGRFFGRGLVADRASVREPLLDLPVHQPQRADWFRSKLLDPRGHPIHRAGLEVDASWRPLGSHGAAAHQGVYAAGSVLAHQDWMRAKCGAGLAIATAQAAAEAVAASLRGEARP